MGDERSGWAQRPRRLTAVASGKSAALLGKLVAGSAQLYEAAVASAQHLTSRECLPPPFSAALSLRAAVATATACGHAAETHRAAREAGLEAARLNAGVASL